MRVRNPHKEFKNGYKSWPVVWNLRDGGQRILDLIPVCPEDNVKVLLRDCGPRQAFRKPEGFIQCRKFEEKLSIGRLRIVSGEVYWHKTKNDG